MDKSQAWSKIADHTKSAWKRSAETTINTLDSLSPAFAPFAQWWDEEAGRRTQLRTQENLKVLLVAQREHNSAASTARQARAQRRLARKQTKNPLAATRRAAATADRAADKHKNAARTDVKAARKNYPHTLRFRAVQAHAGHSVPAALASYLMSTGAHWTLWPATVSAALISLNIVGLALGRRTVTATVPDGVSAEERRLMQRLDPAYWVPNAEARGLAGTVTGVPEVTSGGIACRVRLDGKWTVKLLKAAEDNVRNLLGMKTATRMRITADSEGGWALLTIATRSAAGGTATAWTPERMPADPLLMSLGLDTETGEEVLIPFDERMLVAGASGTGKSWSTRPSMATAHLRGDFVLIDGKGEEANEWDGVCRTAVELPEIDDVIDEIHNEMLSRKAEMKRRRISVWDGKQLTVLVDEGQVVLAWVGKDKDRMQRLIELSSLGRSRGIVLWWATQKPTMSGNAPGVHNLIAPNLLTRFCLRVADAQEAQTALDDCADYQPQKIDRGKQWRGHGYLKDYGPRMIRTWTLDNAGVRALPSKIWHGKPASTQAPAPAPAAPAAYEQAPQTAERPALRLVKDGDFLLAPPATLPAVPAQGAAPAAESTEAKVLDALQKLRPPVRQKDIVEASGLPKGTVSKTVKRLVESGVLIREADGTVAIKARGEASA
ncbi:MarR family transcriptional regulator [Streptomyces sp. NPDC001571]